MSYKLEIDGDGFEKKFFKPFIQPRFPSYEEFWEKFVTPLTNRPRNIHFCSDAELKNKGFGPEHICIAQLHYTVLIQLLRCHLFQTKGNLTPDELIYAMSCLVGAQDVAFELLERFEKRGTGTYDPWIDKRPRGAVANIKGGKEAQDEWKRKDNFPLQDIRDYRNQLIHGRNPPMIISEGVIKLPKLGKQKQFFDWRHVTAAGNPPTADFDSPTNLFNTFFAATVTYIENAWQTRILPHTRATGFNCAPAPRPSRRPRR